MEGLVQLLTRIVKKLYGECEVRAEVVVAPEGTGADYASNVAMRLAKVAKKAPMVIAEEIAAEVRGGIERGNEGGVAEGGVDGAIAGGVAGGVMAGWKVEVAAPGFLNFYAPDEYFLGEMESLGRKCAKNERIYSSDEYDGKMVVTEFSDPNPFKVLHVGHLYTSVVGDAIARMLEGAGARVVRANFGGDVGLHVAKTIWALQNERADAEELVMDRIEKAGVEELTRDRIEKADVAELTIDRIAKAYVSGTQAYEENEAAKKEITELNAEIYKIALEGLREGKVAEIYWRGRELSYQYFEDFYARIGVKFDKYYPESTVAQRGLAEVRKGLAEGVYELSDGAVVYRGEKRGLHTRVFINQAGLPTYEAKDVGLIFTKWDDWKFDESVVITGNDIIEYMKVVLASVGEMAPELKERTRHLTHGQVKLAGNQKMSSRKGNFLKAVDVIEMVQAEIEGADERVVMAAIKYAFLRYKVGGDIIFDPKESVSTTGNSGVYLLYSAVRAKKVLEKCGKVDGMSRDGGSVIRDVGATVRYDESSRMGEFEKKLVKKIVQYEEALTEAVREKAPSKICTYLYELAQEFSRFYENVKVAGSEKQEELAEVVWDYLMVMEHGLGLLGIEVPEEM